MLKKGEKEYDTQKFQTLIHDALLPITMLIHRVAHLHCSGGSDELLGLVMSRCSILVSMPVAPRAPQWFQLDCVVEPSPTFLLGVLFLHFYYSFHIRLGESRAVGLPFLGLHPVSCPPVFRGTCCRWLGQTNTYTRYLEGKGLGSNKERV